MLCQNIITVLESHSPVKYAMEWDNVGLLAGRRNKEVKRIMVALDATEKVVKQAVSAQVDMLVTHHPLIYNARKNICSDDAVGRRLIRLIQADISYYAMHTNFDVIGMAELSAQKLGLTETEPLEETVCETDKTIQGIGRYGCLPREMNLQEFAGYVKSCFALEHIRVCGDPDTPVNLVAVSGGSGKSMVGPALAAGVSVLVSGDFDHHTVLDAVDEGLCIIDAGHYGTEKMFVPYMSDFLGRECRDIEILTAVEKEPFQYM